MKKVSSLLEFLYRNSHQKEYGWLFKIAHDQSPEEFLKDKFPQIYQVFVDSGDNVMKYLGSINSFFNNFYDARKLSKNEKDEAYEKMRELLNKETFQSFEELSTYLKKKLSDKKSISSILSQINHPDVNKITPMLINLLATFSPIKEDVEYLLNNVRHTIPQRIFKLKKLYEMKIKVKDSGLPNLDIYTYKNQNGESDLDYVLEVFQESIDKNKESTTEKKLNRFYDYIWDGAKEDVEYVGYEYVEPMGAKNNHMIIYEDENYKVVHSWSKEAVQFWEKGAVLSDKKSPVFNTCTSAIEGPEGFTGDNFYSNYSSKNIFQVIKKSDTDENGFPLFFNEASDKPNNLLTLLFDDEGEFIDDVSASVNAKDKDISEREVEKIVGKKYEEIKKSIHDRVKLAKVNENNIIKLKLFESIDLDTIVEFVKTAIRPEALTISFINIFSNLFEEFIENNDTSYEKSEVKTIVEESIKNAEKKINTINFFNYELWDTRKYFYRNHIEIIENLYLRDFFKIENKGIFDEYLSLDSSNYPLNVSSNTTTTFINLANNVGIVITREFIERVLIKKLKELSPKEFFWRQLFKISKDRFTNTSYRDLNLNESEKLKRLNRKDIDLYEIINKKLNDISADDLFKYFSESLKLFYDISEELKKISKDRLSENLLSDVIINGIKDLSGKNFIQHMEELKSNPRHSFLHKLSYSDETPIDFLKRVWEEADKVKIKKVKSTLKSINLDDSKSQFWSEDDEYENINMIYKIIRAFPDKDIMNLIFSYNGPIAEALLLDTPDNIMAKVEILLKKTMKSTIHEYEYKYNEIDPEVLNPCLNLLINDFAKNKIFFDEVDDKTKFSYNISEGFAFLERIINNNAFFGGYMHYLLKSSDGIIIFKNTIKVLMETFYNQETIKKIIDAAKLELNESHLNLSLLIEDKGNGNYVTGRVFAPIEKLYKKTKEILEYEMKPLGPYAYLSEEIKEEKKRHAELANDVIRDLKEIKDKVYDSLVNYKLDIYKNRIGLEHEYFWDILKDLKNRNIDINDFIVDAIIKKSGGVPQFLVQNYRKFEDLFGGEFDFADTAYDKTGLDISDISNLQINFEIISEKILEDDNFRMGVEDVVSSSSQPFNFDRNSQTLDAEMWFKNYLYLMPPSKHNYDYEYIKKIAPNYSMEEHIKNLEKRKNQVLETSYQYLLKLPPMYFQELAEIGDEELNKEDFDRREYFLNSYEFEEMYWVPDMIDYIEENYNKFKYELKGIGFIERNHNIKFIEEAIRRGLFLVDKKQGADKEESVDVQGEISFQESDQQKEDMQEDVYNEEEIKEDYEIVGEETFSEQIEEDQAEKETFQEGEYE